MRKFSAKIKGWTDLRQCWDFLECHWIGDPRQCRGWLRRRGRRLRRRPAKPNCRKFRTAWRAARWRTGPRRRSPLNRNCSRSRLRWRSSRRRSGRPRRSGWTAGLTRRLWLRGRQLPRRTCLKQNKKEKTHF